MKKSGRIAVKTTFAFCRCGPALEVFAVWPALPCDDLRAAPACCIQTIVPENGRDFALGFSAQTFLSLYSRKHLII
jgi:hypothetical protein